MIFINQVLILQKKFKKKILNFTNIFPKKKFDVIICSEVFEHLENPTIILKKLNKSIHIVMVFF